MNLVLVDLMFCDLFFVFVIVNWVILLLILGVREVFGIVYL